jgi:hypothetical protein
MSIAQHVNPLSRFIETRCSLGIEDSTKADTTVTTMKGNRSNAFRLRDSGLNCFISHLSLPTLGPPSGTLCQSDGLFDFASRPSYSPP